MHLILWGEVSHFKCRQLDPCKKRERDAEVGFGLNVSFLMKIIMSLQARIDSHNKILYARHADQRNATFQRVLQTGNEFDRDVRAMLLRANLLKHDYNLRASRKLWILDWSMTKIFLIRFLIFPCLASWCAEAYCKTLKEDWLSMVVDCILRILGYTVLYILKNLSWVSIICFCLHFFKYLCSWSCYFIRFYIATITLLYKLNVQTDWIKDL